MLNPEVWSIISDIIVSLSAAGAAIFAARGLNAWRKELNGRTNFDLARRIMINVLRLRDALHHARFYIVNNYEFPQGYDPVQEHTPEEEAKAFLHLYDKRWNPIEKILQELESDQLEASVLWKWIESQVIGELIMHVRDYRYACHEEIGHMEGLRTLTQPEIEKIRKIVFSPKDFSENDEYNKKTNEIISIVQNYLSTYLNTGNSRKRSRVSKKDVLALQIGNRE